MTRHCYQIRPGTRLSLEPDGRYRIEVAESQATARLDPPAVAPLLYVDGRRSTEEIEGLMASQQAALPPGVMDRIMVGMQRLGALELIETEWLPLERVAWPRHKCFGCGGSCQGHWVGPLSQAFVTETSQRLADLRQKYPQLEDRRAFVRLAAGDPDLYLNAETGQCVFLDADFQCILHREYGAAGKPSQCRAFPLVRSEDGARTRLAVGLTCLRQFDQRLDEGGQIDAGDQAWTDENERLGGRHYHYVTAGDEADEEEELLALVRGAEDPFGAVLEQLAPKMVRGRRKDIAGQLEQQSRQFLRRLEECIAEDPVIDGASKLVGLYPERLAAIRALAQHGRGKSKRSDGPRTTTLAKSTQVRLVLRDALERYLFLRRYRLFVGMDVAMAAFALGVWTALALVPAATNGEETERARLFGQYLVAWWRPMQLPLARLDVVADDTEAGRYLALFERFWRTR